MPSRLRIYFRDPRIYFPPRIQPSRVFRPQTLYVTGHLERTFFCLFTREWDRDN